MRTPKQFVLVRKDLPWPVQIVQACHAASEAIRIAPVDQRTAIVLLHVEDEPELKLYAQKFADKGYFFKLIEEPDEPFNGAAMALATEPMTERVSAFSKLVFHLSPAQ